ncbi:MAG: fatty acid desaturase [Xanthomonadales bacterium]|nr:fatty acid desaturase [Xanthomonadales bacterium]MBP7624124.1 fatty acid desaturase [Xanthomonadales bacterium]
MDRWIVDAAKAFARWFDTDTDAEPGADAHRIDWVRVIPFIGLHLAALIGVWFVGISWFAFWTAVVLYAVRMFAITGFYHRYFSHKTFKTSRPVQFLFAIVGAASVQRGPLWWAAHHRNHHRHSDTELDVHSPVTRSFFVSHMGWFLTKAGFRTDRAVIADLMKFPELRLVDRFDVFVPIALATALFLLGGWLGEHRPELGTSAAQLLIWGFFVSTVVLFHATVTINSFAHRFGSRRYKTRDDSRNNWLLALITFGEGWHNNHHHFPGSARNGFFWWEYDLTFYVLKLMSVCRLVWDLKSVPPQLKYAR